MPFWWSSPANDANDVAEDENESYSTNGPIGLSILADPTAAIVDIVFVHGLTGNREATWTSKKTFWPKDLLPADVPKARIVTWGYDADITRLGISAAGSNTLRDHGKNLATDIALWRKKSSTSTTRPLIFVAHSLGGLVVEQALLISRGAAEDYLRVVIEAICGIIFMGTPHGGADAAKYVSTLSNLSNVLNRTNTEIMALLTPTSEMLANVQQEFHTMLRQRTLQEGKHVKLYCFYEEVALRGIGKVVPDHSAILSSTENSAIHGTHMSMTKFIDKNDPGYVRVSGQIWLWIEDLQTQSPQQNGTARHMQEPSGQEGRKQRRVPRLLEYSGTVNAEAGPVMQGSFNAGRDISVSGRRQ